MIVTITDKDTLKEVLRHFKPHDGNTHPVLREAALYAFWGALITVKYLDNAPASINMTKIGKRKKNTWEPYANWYGAYTLPAHRRTGLATELYKNAESLALAAGCHRIKSLAGSSAGLALHRSLGHACWGMTANGEVWVDSPLPGHGGRYGANLPPQAPGARMTDAEIDNMIKKGLRYDKD